MPRPPSARVVGLVFLFAELALADVAVEGTWTRRYNYLFQNGGANPAGLRTVDVTNVTAAVVVTPR